jgi:hypothetical protein
MAANLKGRLARIRKLGLVKADALDQAADARLAVTNRRGATIRRDKPSFLDGWEETGEMAWTRTLRRDLYFPESVDPAVFAPLRRPRRGGFFQATENPARVPSARILAERLCFFDLETTGLSGGTGTMAFLAAVGRLEGDELALTQIFLEDYPGESSFLNALLPLLDGEISLASYNGKAFDMPLIRTRCVMNGMAPPEPAFHLDALFASRRLWRRVHGGASLGLLEREVLGLERGEDLPGALIPEAWLSFVRTGDNPLMRLVLSHNADDVIGLARLLARAQAIFDDPRSRMARTDLDRAGLGRGLLAVGRYDEGEELLEAAAGDGDEGAGVLISMRYRKAGRIEDCLRVAAMMPESYRSAVEVAKLYERFVGDLGEAERWAKEALRLAPGNTEREAAWRRLARIERKLSRNE